MTDTLDRARKVLKSALHGGQFTPTVEGLELLIDAKVRAILAEKTKPPEPATAGEDERADKWMYSLFGPEWNLLVFHSRHLGSVTANEIRKAYMDALRAAERERDEATEDAEEHRNLLTELMTLRQKYYVESDLGIVEWLDEQLFTFSKFRAQVAVVDMAIQVAKDRIQRALALLSQGGSVDGLETNRKRTKRRNGDPLCSVL